MAGSSRPTPRWILAAVVAVLAGAPVAASAGVVVERAGTELVAAGLGPGAVLGAWESTSDPERRGTLARYADWLAVEAEERPRGPLRLPRADRTVPATLGPLDELTVRPDLGTLEERYRALVTGESAPSPDELARALTDLAASAGASGATEASWWLALEAAAATAAAGDVGSALDRVTETCTRLAAGGQADWLLHCQGLRGDLATQAERWEAAREARLAAVAVAAAAWDGSLRHAGALAALARDHADAGEHAAAVASWQRAIAISERQAPGSLLLARHQVELATLLLVARELEGAHALYVRALSVLAVEAPEGADHARTLANLGLTELYQGRLAAAQAHLEQALALRRRQGPDGRPAANVLNNLGLVAERRGDLVRAERSYLEALAIYRRLAADDAAVGRTLLNLGNVANHRRELDRAESYYHEALALLSSGAESLDLASVLNDLGDLAEQRGRLGEAEAHLRRSLAILERLAPASGDHAQTLANLGFVVAAGGDRAEGLRLVREAVHRLPESTAGGMAWHTLGELLRDGGDLAGAEAAFRQALAIREQLLPGSFDAAMTLHQLGGLAHRAGSLVDAEAYHQRAVEALDAQLLVLGGSQATAGDFRAHFYRIDRDHVRVLLELGRSREAFGALEAARARAFLAQLRQRELSWASDDLPGELATRRTALTGEALRLRSELATLPAGDREARGPLLAALRRNDDERRAVEAEIRQRAPRVAALELAQTQDLDEAQRSLPDDAAFLTVNLGDQSSHLLVVTRRRGLAVYPLPAGETEIASRVAELRDAIATPASDGGEVDALATGLYDLLIAPAEPQLAGIENLVIAPDGPLHLLPFGALRQPSGSYLVERWTPSIVLSATAYARLRSHRSPVAANASVAAIADPQYTPSEAAPGALRGTPDYLSAVERSRRLVSLPSSRLEAEAVAAVFPGAVETLLGPRATETEVRRVAPGVDKLHFACHGLLDPSVPLSSGLALSVPTPGAVGDDGFLQAWEVIETMRLAASLVVLSACNTGVGPQAGGEGVIGLSRAFQYAGARSVIASLWSIADASTAALMTRLYRHHAAGADGAAALREAQLDLLRGRPEPNGAARDPGPSPSHHLAAAAATDVRYAAPFHWAAFQHYGAP